MLTLKETNEQPINITFVCIGTKSKNQLYRLPIKPNDHIFDYSSIVTKLTNNDYHKDAPDELLTNFYLFLGLNQCIATVEMADIYITVKNSHLIDSIINTVKSMFKRYKKEFGYSVLN